MINITVNELFGSTPVYKIYASIIKSITLAFLGHDPLVKWLLYNMIRVVMACKTNEKKKKTHTFQNTGRKLSWNY